MKYLFIIDGVAGIVKDDLIKYVKNEMSPNSTIIMKFTTREIRCTDRNIDLIHISDEEYKEKENKPEKYYTYPYGKKEDGYGIGYYAISKESIYDALKIYEFVFLIVRNRRVIHKIINDFKERAKVIPVFIYSDKSCVYSRMKNEKFSSEDINARMNRLDQIWKDYATKPDIFDMSIFINDASEENLQKHLEQLIIKYSTQKEDELYVMPNKVFKLIRPLVGYKDRLAKQLEVFPYNKNIFLMMKFRDDANEKYCNTEIFEVIKNTIEKNGYNCVRADQAEWINLIQNSVYNPIAVAYCCKYGIALIDEPEEGATYNPNVIYELGMMETQGKECILLRDRKVQEIPFDLTKEIHKVYKNTVDIKKYLEIWIQTLES